MFTNDELAELTEDPVLIEHVDDGRWDRHERIIFIKDRKFYSVMRSSGLTEYQDYPPEYNDCVQVRPVAVTTTQWIEVK